MISKLKANQARKTYSEEAFSKSSGIPEFHKAIIGQERAVKALRFGLGNRAPGFNVYVSVPHSDNKISLVNHFLNELAVKEPVPPDYCYVNNFKDPYCPKVLELPPGTGIEFKNDVETYIREVKMALIKAFESEEYATKQSEIKQSYSRAQQDIIKMVEEQARQINFVIKSSPLEIVAVPLKDDKPMSEKQFKALGEEERHRIIEKQNLFKKTIQDTVRKSRKLEKKAARKLKELERDAALFAIDFLTHELQEKYIGISGFKGYMNEMKADILTNLSLFVGENEKGSIFQRTRKAEDYTPYKVNVFVDNTGLTHAPVVVELNPSFINLFGKIERESVMGALVTDFTLIRSGTLHQANGGYLILPVDDLVRSPFAYDHLKRSLRNRRIEIEDPTERLGLISTKSLKPAPIPLHVQVILIGRDWILHILYNYDDDFRDLFKVKAEFDSVMPSNAGNIQELTGFIQNLCSEESLFPVSRSAMAKIVEFGHRIASHQDKITTQTEILADLVREAHFYAHEDESSQIHADHIQLAIQEKIYRSNLIEEKIRELITDKTILIDHEGLKIGQINGLSVIDLGDFAFGRPSRITAMVSVGTNGIIDIEREAKLGGPIHTKGVLILTGFLYDRFGKDKPINLSLHLVFEQSYGGIEGDSASSAELYAILSALSEIPLKQNIAVTGSVNQKGEIQAVGGINEKIEGFYDLCAFKGLTGDQGVIIPRANEKHLMLKEKVVMSIEKEEFHLWAIDSIEEGIEILTGLPAGESEWDDKNHILHYPEGTLFTKVNDRIEQLSRRYKNFDKEKDKKENE